jgi:prepilin-type N-terminal cleavage/methylation domain-containing protein
MLCPGKGSKFSPAFTAIELLCVLAILGLLAALAVPALADWAAAGALETAAHRLAQDMRRIQQAAITSGLTSEIQFYEYANRYRLIDNAADKEIFVDLPPGIAYRSNNFPVSAGKRTLKFYRSGAPNQGGSVGLKNERGEILYVIVTPATGRVRISPEPPDW